jgi:hypothetical protein
MTIRDIALRINKVAETENRKFNKLQNIRNDHGLKPRSWKPFADFSIMHRYAFHAGGMKEFQFNIGKDHLNGKDVFRFGVAFSLERNKSNTNPLENALPRINRFNNFLKDNPHFFRGYKMWYYMGKDFHKYYDSVKEINDRLVKEGNFIFIGKYFEKKITDINDVDVRVILESFDHFIALYETVQFEEKAIDILFARLCWNINGWETPSGHPWKVENQKKDDKSFEQQYGYGHEEWLLNPKFSYKGMQYGFIQGLSNARAGKYLNELHLFTIEDKTKLRFYIGSIKNVERLTYEEIIKEGIDTWISQYLKEMENEVRFVHADYKKFRELKQLPNLRFTLDDLNLLPEPKIITSKTFINSYFRYRPFEVPYDLLNSFQKKSDEVVFSPGGPGEKVSSYQRGKNENQKGLIKKYHNDIEKDLYIYLKNHLMINPNLISCGRTSIEGNIIDIAVIDNKMNYEIYEIKTTLNIRTNIRDAIGQLLDYAFWSNKIKIKKIIIVSPSKLDEKSKEYLIRLQNILNVALEYWQYKKGSKIITELFNVFMP